MIITAAYILRVISQVFFGPVPAELEHQVSDIRLLDKISILILAAFMVGIGIFPSLLSGMVQSGVQHVLQLLGGV